MGIWSKSETYSRCKARLIAQGLNTNQVTKIEPKPVVKLVISKQSSL